MAATEYELLPHVGVGPVHLNMTREQCRAVMPEPPHVFRKSPDDAAGTDAFHESAFQVFYDAGERVQYIELSNTPDVDATLDGVSVLRVPSDDAVAHVGRLGEFDRNHPELGYSYVFPTLDLALWRPVIPEHENDPEGRTFSTVGVGVRGYFARG